MAARGVVSSTTLYSQAVAASAGISAMPTFQVYRAGEKAEELVGASKQKLKDLIEKYSSIKA